MHVRRGALQDFGKADGCRSMPLQPMSPAIRKRFFDCHHHQAFDVRARRCNERLRGHRRERRAGGTPLLRSVRIAAHDRAGRGAGDHVRKGWWHRQQRVVSARHGAVRHPATAVGDSGTWHPAIRWQSANLRTWKQGCRRRADQRLSPGGASSNAQLIMYPDASHGAQSQERFLDRARLFLDR
jgi:hypothetical protein